jgi:CysZ protein
MSELLTGAAYVLKGVRLLRRRGVRAYVVMPLLINLVLFGAVLAFGSHWFSQLIDAWIPEWLRWIEWLLWAVFAVLAASLVFFGFVIVANLVASPFNGFLAEAAEIALTGRRPVPPGGSRSLIAEAGINVMAEVRKIGYLAPRALPLLILFVVPGLQILAPFLWFLFGAWALALTYFDYPMANHGIPFTEQRRLAAARRQLAMGFGMAAMLLTLTPFLNFIAMPAAVAGATALWVERLRPPADPPAPTALN